MKVWSKCHRPPRISFPAESEIAISRFHLPVPYTGETEKTINPVYSVNPVYPACLVKSLLGHLYWVGPRGIAGTGRQIVLGSNIKNYNSTDHRFFED